ncbi:MAG: FHA domain-containing protein [Lachnospiraceae bacterium]|nr:FHA domain-containing protein [Lachnospiraceae bacterium]
MGKFKLTSDKNVTKLYYKTAKDQYLNKREAELLSNGMLKGLYKLEVVSNGKIFILQWNLDGKMSMTDFLGMVPLNRKTFIGFLEQFINLIYTVNESGLDFNRLLYGLDDVKITPSSRKLEFIYVPVMPFNSGSNLNELIGNILQEASYSLYEDHIYINEFIEIMNSDAGLNLEQLEKYVKNQKNMESKTKSASSYVFANKKRRCPKCQSLVEEANAFCPICGFHIINETNCPFLIRNSNKERITLFCFPFVIGKNPDSSNYFVKNNSLVSRKHAIIYKVGDSFFLSDAGSTNGTFIYGRRLMVDEKCEINNGTIFTIADEEYIFYTE